MNERYEVKKRGKWPGLASIAITVAVALCTTPLASAQDKNKDKNQNQSTAEKKENPKDLAFEKGQTPEGSWRAEDLLDTEVFGKNGKEIGSVENLLINDQGQIVAVVAQVGGFWDMGDTHVAVPWEEVSIRNMNVHAPITQDNAGDYSIFKEAYFSQYDVGEITTVEDDLDTGTKIWKATNLIDDYVLLENNIGYGYVSDLVFDSGGKLQSVVVSASNPDYDYGYYAYPWYGYGYDYGWDPGLDYYVLPYNDEDFAGV